MNEIEKDEIISKFMSDQIKLTDLPAITQINRYYKLVSDLLTNTYNKAREEGFKEGFKEGKKEIERKYSKLN